MLYSAGPNTQLPYFMQTINKCILWKFQLQYMMRSQAHQKTALKSVSLGLTINLCFIYLFCYLCIWNCMNISLAKDDHIIHCVKTLAIEPKNPKTHMVDREKQFPRVVLFTCVPWYSLPHINTKDKQIDSK